MRSSIAASNGHRHVFRPARHSLSLIQHHCMVLFIICRYVFIFYLLSLSLSSKIELSILYGSTLFSFSRRLFDWWRISRDAESYQAGRSLISIHYGHKCLRLILPSILTGLFNFSLIHIQWCDHWSLSPHSQHRHRGQLPQLQQSYGREFTGSPQASATRGQSQALLHGPYTARAKLCDSGSIT